MLISIFIQQSLYAQPGIFTPDSKVNADIAGKPVSEIDLIRFDVCDDQLTIDPQIPAHWTWIAGKDFRYRGKPLDFFFRNGILFTNDVDVVSFRYRKYPESLTDAIEANTFVVGMQKRDEAVIFAATEEEKDVHLVIDKRVYGEEKVFDFHLRANESKMIRIFRLQPPFKP